MITLNIQDKTIILNTHEVEGQTLYKAQDLLNGFGYEAKKTNKTIYNWNVSMKTKHPDFQAVSIQGRNGGTYLTKRQIMKLAGFVDYDFEDAVYEAFENLVEGNVAKAQAIALSRAIVHPVMEMKIRKPAIKQLFEQSGLNVVHFSEQFLSNMDGNLKVTNKERAKTAKSLNDVVHEVHVQAGKELDITKMALCEKAKRLIATYVKSKTSQSVKQSLTKLKNKIAA